jgi:hypothetical protein
MNRNSLIPVVAFAVMFWSGHAVGGAVHPYHVSLTEIEWNARTGNFEVAVCLWPNDLETALSSQEHQAVNLDATPNLDQILAKYVEKTCTCRVGDQRTTLRWVGHETNNKQAWLYFELRPGEQSGSENSWSFRNAMFFELNADQQNHVNFSVGKRLETGICTVSNPDVVLRHLVNRDDQ